MVNPDRVKQSRLIGWLTHADPLPARTSNGLPQS